MPNDQANWVPEDTFASRLRALRDAMHLTVPEICELCEVPVPTWRKWEHGASPRGLDVHVKKISERTGVDRDWLLWGRVSPEYPWFGHGVQLALPLRHAIVAEATLEVVR